ncbi:sporulation protein YqfC [Thermoactinomyces sp. AMNI-1]|uniref:Sporulation protein YqfC n=2 Tax=Thermoactinomyces mirandus TaxID=2756294 RepID=A0A7W2AQQ9_9BACL|nr:sporulation protein YqfC [Thermoactinomyces mirandus]
MRKWVSDWFDLPVHVTGDTPRIEMIGTMAMQVENYLQLEKFNFSELQIKVKDGILEIKGEQLKIKAIDPEIVLIEGQILEIRYKK